MSESRQWHLDIMSLFILLAGFFLSFCVIASDPTNPTATHLLGPGGHWVAERLQTTLGLSVYVAIASWFCLVFVLYFRHQRWSWIRRLVGWVILVPTVALMSDWWGHAITNPILPGPGGTLGAFLAFWLQGHYHPSVQLSLAWSALASGLFLAFDFIMIRLVRILGQGTWRMVRRFIQYFSSTSKVPETTLEQLSRVPVVSTTSSSKPGRGKKACADEVSTPTGLDNPLEPHTGLDSDNGDRSIPIFHHDGPTEELEPVSTAIVAPTLVKAPTEQSEAERFANYQLPPLTLLEDPQPSSIGNQDEKLRERASLLEKVFADFGVNVRVVGINTGPVVTQFEIALETGLRVNKVTVLADDIALNLSVSGVRMVAPIPGKNTVGVEIPNERRDIVCLKDVIMTSSKKVAKSKLPLFLGKDSEGRPLVYDLAEMPHLLIAGSTGTGKSVCMNTIILSILMTRRPDEVKMVMIDPKMAEMSEYGKVPHLMHPVVTDMKKAEAILAWAVEKMEERYEYLSKARVRNLASYNELSSEEIYRRCGIATEEERKQIPTHMPYVVILIDEMADLMMQMKKEVEGHIIRLAQKSRAAGIHLVVATQRPTVDVVTGLIKSNLPARICFKVVSKSDSRVVLDAMGADKLLGRGDMLLLPPGSSDLVRAQGTYASNDEITNVVLSIESEPCYAPELMQLKTRDEEDSPAGTSGQFNVRDELYEAAIEVIIREGRGSVSLLQRALQIGYGRAARLVDFMAEDGIVGAYNGSNAREVLITAEEWLRMRGGRSKTA